MRISKPISILYMVICLTGVFCLAFQSGPLYIIGWFLFCSLLYMIAITIVSRRKQKLLLDCKPSAYIAFAEKVCSPTLKNVMARNSYYLNLYAAYNDLGLEEQADWYLDRVVIPAPKKGTLGDTQALVYYINQSGRFMNRGDIERAGLALWDAERILSDSKINSGTKKTCFLTMQRLRYIWNMENGDYRDAEYFFSGLFRVEDSLRSRVMAKYRLAQIYRHEGKLDLAREACRYVVEKGGETRYAREAAAWLSEMTTANA